MLKFGCTDRKDGLKGLSQSNPKAFDFLEASGSYREIGVQIGKKVQGTLYDILNKRKNWIARLGEIALSADGQIYSRNLLGISRNKFPQYVQEIEGIAMGAGVDFQIVWRMTIQSELDALISREDGCSTIYYKNKNRIWLFHNEDGDKVYHNRLLALKCLPPSGVNFYSIVYPGIIAGIGPSINSIGICQTTNFISSKKPMEGIPRFILARAALESKNFAEAISQVTESPRAFPWHHNILSMNDNMYASIETLPDGTVDANYQGDGLFVHTNHTLGRKTELYADQNENYKNTSSVPRMRVLQQLLSNADLPISYPEKLLWFLSSHKNKPYSPCRHPEGDVRGQTLAAAFFDSSRKSMRIYKGNPCDSVEMANYSEYSF